MRFHEHVKGDVAEHQAIIWLWQKGYLVCKNLSQHGPVDLVAIKENETIQFIAQFHLVFFTVNWYISIPPHPSQLC